MLGYPEDSTLADKITMDERQIILGKAMDANCLEYFFTICTALSENSLTQTKTVQFTAPPTDSFIALTASFDEPELEHTPIAERWWHDPDQHTGVSHALCGLEKYIEADTEAHLSAADKRLESDVWVEPLFLAFLQTYEYPINTTD